MFTTKIENAEYPDLNTINHAGMRFYKTPEGVFLPSITTILGDEEKPWLTQWKQALGPKKAAKEQQRCADRGSNVHEMCEKFINNVDDPTAGFDGSDIKLFNQLRMRLRKHVNNIYAQEIALWDHVLKLAGRVDLVAEYDGVLSVIDFKTSNGIKQEQDITDYFLQATSYALMYENLYGLKIDQIVIMIAVERSFLPLVFKKNIDEYITPLVERIEKFYSTKQSIIDKVNGK